jgi:hypothetical protein
MPNAAGGASPYRENNFAGHRPATRPANNLFNTQPKYYKRNITKFRYFHEWLSNRKSGRIASAMRASAGMSCRVADAGALLPAVASGIGLVALFFADSRIQGRAIAVSTMISEVYAAFIAAGAPEDKARKAAETLADREDRFPRIDTRFIVLKWMVGLAVALDVAILTRSFFH